MNDSPSLAELLEVSKHFGLPSPALVEKDWSVVYAMRAIASVDATPFRLVFAGGTALARAHKLVRRMSEDVDFKIVSPSNAVMSNNQLRKQLGELRGRITASLQAAGFAIDTTDARQLRSRDANKYTVYNLHYAEAGEAGAALRPTIQIELSYATLRRPSVALPVSSFVNEAYGRPPEISKIECVSITETAAEKLVALTRRSAMVLAGLSRDPDPTLVRHIYDLHAICDHIDKAMKAWTTEAARRSLYCNFVAAMVYGEAADFAMAMATVAGLVNAAWPV